MKPRLINHPVRAFTLFELTLVTLVVILVLAILYSISLTQYRAVKQHKLRLQCEINLTEIGSAFIRWSNDHNGKFPMQVAGMDGGTKESVATGNAVPSFQVLSNQLQNPGFLICPADRTRVPATNFCSNFTGANIVIS
jgi:hypothetical protein